MCEVLHSQGDVSIICSINAKPPNFDHAVKVQPTINATMLSKSCSETEYLSVEVRYPRTYKHLNKGKYTDYEVYIETNKIAFSRRTSTVRRRFSEFLWLRKQLGSVEVNGLGKGNVPELPPKKMIGRFHPSFLSLRQQGLQDFLESVLDINKFLSFSGLHLFLQSPMTVEEIEAFLEGKYPEKTVEDMMEDFGCATNTDNPFSVFLRSNKSDIIINNRAGRSVSYDRIPSTVSQDDKILSRSSMESSDISSGSYTGMFY
ncbi:sorting nexin-11-like [Dendronephthya gigantea]|uniref:sorting nexin-11-like n=1 Tax=Dendronephthya gigantea TaxID=151771 RepID=UPI001069AC8E|nr:sorting nexin-11-like [Dendronephthya gigantea]